MAAPADLEALFELEGFFQSVAASSVGDKKIASRAAQVGPTHFLEFIFTIEIPKKQGHVGILMANDSLVDFDADGGVVGL